MRIFRGSNYSCSNDGRVFNNKTGRELKQKTTRLGYKIVCLYLSKKKKYFFVHRVVAELFINNPYGKKEVNHINGVKSDNRYENLEWSTSSENQKHAHFTGLQKATRLLGYKNGTYKGVIFGKRLSDGKLIKIRALTDCASLGFTQSSVHKVINKQLKTHKGYVFWRDENGE